VVALQEIRASAVAAWQAEFERIGLPYVAYTLPADGPLRSPDRRLGVLIASRRPVEVCAPLDLPWPERHLAVRMELDGVQIEIHNLHAPLSNKPDRTKARTLETLFEHLASPSDTPRILVGDLNTPQYESREGQVHSFARTRSGRIRPEYGERHDRAELALIVGLAEHGYVDAFRSLHGYGRRDRSWLYPNGKMGYRLDHIIVRGMEVVACDYEHGWRETRLSDHAAMWAELVRTGTALRQ
jgi:endonuclease/exonuclease/phosphatase family metal-dependent hydrolase